MTPARAAPTIERPDFADAGAVADDRDDATVAALLQMRHGGVAEVDRAHQVDVDLALPLGRRGVLERLADRETSIVDDSVEAAEAVDDGGHHRGDRGLIGEVGLDGVRLAAARDDLGDDRGRLVGRAAVVDGHSGALGGQRERDLAADVPRSSGHECDASSELGLHGLSSLRPCRCLQLGLSDPRCAAPLNVARR